MKRITFICTGNTCRSPMAACYFKSIVPENEVEVKSAGLAAAEGLNASAEAVLVMQEQGLDLSTHLSDFVTVEKVADSDMLIVMTEMHRKILVSRWPEVKDKIYLLMEFSGKSSDRCDVFDPVGLSIIEYRSCFNMMKKPLDRLGEIICKKK